jgi:probable F420-dependent oxidoreductase
MVQFGILLSDDEPAAMVERAQRAEQAGFDSVFVGHHRFTPGFGHTVHPWILLSAIAARTDRIRLGTSIFLLPLAHPLDVAEEVASLDVVSGGRVIFGPGVGYRRYEFEAMGVPFSQRGRRTTEALEILNGVWENETFSYHGEFYSFEDVSVTPRPVQQPRIPIWVGANLDPAMERAARLADGWIVGFSDRLPKLVPRVERYRRLATDNGRRSTVALMRLVGIGTSREQVEREWWPGIYRMLRGYAKVEAPTDRGDATEHSLKAARRGEISLEELGNDMLIAGTPDDVVAGLRRAVDETGCEHLLVYTGGTPSDELFDMFRTDVMPALG